MDVMIRNLLRLLRAGTFEEQEAIEPLSAWKWSRLFQLSIAQGVGALVYDGITHCKDQFFLQVPHQLEATWKNLILQIEQRNRTVNAGLSELFTLLSQEQTRPVLMKGPATAILYENPLHRTAGDIDIYFPYPTQAKKADAWAREHAVGTESPDNYTLAYTWRDVRIEHHHRAQRLTNTLHNRTLQNIIETEFHTSSPTYVTINATKIETLSPTLSLLLMIIRIAAYLMGDGLSLKQLTDLGMFLRKEGHHVDFIKLQAWIDRLHMNRFAQLEGQLLVNLLSFVPEEIPYAETDHPDEALSRVIDELFTLQLESADEKTISATNFYSAAVTSSMLWHVRRSAHYFRYHPSESLTNFFASFAHSLSHIEE